MTILGKRMAVKKKINYKLDSNAWMSTYTDLMTLLLTFFVLLLSLSTMDKNRKLETKTQSIITLLFIAIPLLLTKNCGALIYRLSITIASANPQLRLRNCLIL